jgi:hypothetical protein
MTETNKNIDTIYSKAFANFKVELPVEDYNSFSKKINHQNFMKLGIHHFNIYYVALIIIIPGMTLFTAIKSHPSEKTKQISEIIENSDKTIKTGKKAGSNKEEDKDIATIYSDSPRSQDINKNSNNRIDITDAKNINVDSVENANESTQKTNLPFKSIKRDSVSISYSVNYSPNILPNGSFEEEKNLLFTNKSKTWKVCIAEDSPDLFCFDNRKTNELLTTYQGGAKPYAGKCSVGLFVYRVDEALKYQNVREFIYIKLDSPLKKDSTYVIEINIQLDAESNVTIEHFNALFSKNKIEAKSVQTLFKNIPQINFNTKNVDNTKWVKLQTEYVASGDENYVAFGNFKSDKNTETKIIQPPIDERKPKWKLEKGEQAAYFYIDDIKIRQVRKVEVVTQVSHPD